MTREVLLLRPNEIANLLDMPSCMEVVEVALGAYSSGQAELPAIIHLDIPEEAAEIHVKAGYVHGSPIYATKFASGFPGNAARGLPTADGLVLVFDAHTGAPLAFLLDDGRITDVRTGAAGGIAARYLAPPVVDTVAVIGTGAQARWQLEAVALALASPISEVRFWGRDDRKAQRCADDASQWFIDEAPRTLVADTVGEAVAGADLVITCTASREPLVFEEMLTSHALVIAVGSDGVGKQELAAEVLGRADVIVADSRQQCLERGELQHALADGLIHNPDALPELGDVIAGTRPGRTSPDQLIVCDLTGIGVQDVAAAALILERATEARVGERISL